MIMRITVWSLGTLAIMTGVIFFLACQGRPEDFWFPWLGGGTFLAAGLAYCIAGAKNYRGHWSFVLGVAFLVIAAIFTGLVLDGHAIQLKTSGDKLFAVVFIGFIFLCGVLSLWSGHKLHCCSLALEARPQTQPNPQGGADGWPVGSETNRAPLAADFPRS